MDADLALVLGLLIGALSIPSIVSALSDARTPRASAVTVLIAGGLIIFALQTKPGGYSFEALPNVIISVVARYIP
ncbi:hypothetical protein [Thalassococcus sp. S3]|uniref:hypothetical protein n=1 Tax=Thalassococcus sp. S3 TaxID=2017482 RepID=UPI001023FC33|nr:hypothetical protein [Thalassococcus sp. S3]QBF30389.1 hypothetical protein CFI11_04050 [Thalassococcus sp. S3]